MRPPVSRIGTPAPQHSPHPVQQDEHQTSTPPAGPRTRRLLAVEEAGEYLGVSRATVERLVFRGQLPIVKIGGATRYDIEDLDRFVESNRRRNRRRTT